MKSAAQEIAQAVERERRKFFRYARMRLSRASVMDVEDIVSDVVFGLLNRADVFGEIENWVAYAYRALEPRIPDFRRADRPTLSLDDEESPGLAEALASVSDNPENQAANLELRGRLVQALEALAPAERALWTATEIEGRSFQELAEEWGEPVGTLLSRKCRARAKLRELLKDCN